MCSVSRGSTPSREAGDEVGGGDDAALELSWCAVVLGGEQGGVGGGGSEVDAPEQRPGENGLVGRSEGSEGSGRGPAHDGDAGVQLKPGLDGGAAMAPRIPPPAATRAASNGGPSTSTSQPEQRTSHPTDSTASE